jgi:hypothetical protein
MHHIVSSLLFVPCFYRDSKRDANIRYSLTRTLNFSPFAIANSKPVIIALGMSPIGGIVRIGPPMHQLLRIFRAESARNRKNKNLDLSLAPVDE